MSEPAVVGNWAHHTVTFYDADSELVHDLARYVDDGLAGSDRVIVIATGSHRDALDEVLIQYGHDPAHARVAGRYLTLDAAETVAKFIVNGAPDRKRFFDVVGSLVVAAGADGCGVRAFGEMVALLWQEGNVGAALQLETLWNELLATSRCMLLCAYPASSVSKAALGDTNLVCRLHSAIVPPRVYSTVTGDDVQVPAGPSRVSDAFLPVNAAVPAARRFVAETLRAWGQQALGSNAALVTSELATNAVVHARSPFRLRIERRDSRVRITLEDVGPTLPEVRAAQQDAVGGRGITIIESVSQHWGCDVVADGKAVWVELVAGQ